MYLGVFGLSVEEKIAKYAAENYPAAPYTYDQYLSAVKTIIPVYNMAILQGNFKPFVYAETENAQALLNYLWELTHVTGNLIGVVMSTIEAMAKGGLIDWGVYVPTMKKADTTAADLVSKIFPTAPIGQYVSDTTNKLLFTAGIVTLIYLFGKGFLYGKTRT